MSETECTCSKMPATAAAPEAGIQKVRDPFCPVHGEQADRPAESIRELIRANEEQIRKFETGGLKVGGQHLDLDGTATAAEVTRLKERNEGLKQQLAERMRAKGTPQGSL